MRTGNIHSGWYFLGSGPKVGSSSQSFTSLRRFTLFPLHTPSSPSHYAPEGRGYGNEWMSDVRSEWTRGITGEQRQTAGIESDVRHAVRRSFLTSRVSPPHVTLSLLITRSVHVGSYPLLPFTSRSERKWVKWGGERYERHEPRARILHRFNGWFLGVPDGVFRSVCQSFTLPSLPSPRSVPYGHVPRDEGRRWTTWVNRQTETRRESDVEGQERGENGRGNHW